jgi:hypothetical protein
LGDKEMLPTPSNLAEGGNGGHTEQRGGGVVPAKRKRRSFGLEDQVGEEIVLEDKEREINVWLW